MKVSAFACASVSLALFGCASPIHKHDTFGAPNPVDILSIDAKQRVVFVVRGDKGQTVTCAEPSPDALSALSNSVGGSLQDPKVAASFAASQVESAASIGLRTTSIQLLRDGMYHLCEQYAAGGMSGDKWVQEQRRYQNLMLSLLSIEQLTGAVSPRQVGLGGGSASGSVGDKAGDAAADVANANADLTAAQTALSKAQDTQASDQKACTADSSSTTCANAAADATAVTNAKKSMDEATENQKTARQALQAARGAVTADATGAKVSFSDATKPYQMTDASARYISEATRSIVTTTLLASFAQEECTRVWDYIDKVPLDKLAAFVASYPAPTRTGATGEAGTQTVSLAGEVLQLAKNCQTNEKQLLAQPAMFTPQYGQETGAPLKVLGASNGITLLLKQAVSLIIVGGDRPYHVSGLTPDLAKELEANIPTPQDGSVFSLTLQRPDGAAKTSGSVTISVADSYNAYVDIPVNFAKPVDKTPEAKSAGVAKITSVTSNDAHFKVSFTLPTPATVKGYVAKAANQSKGSTEVLQRTGAADAKEIDIEKCQVGASYAISLEVTPTTGSATTVKYSKTVPCAGSAAIPPPKTTTPGPPTDVQAQAQAGGKIVVTFKAAAAGADTATVTGYTAVAAPVTKDGKPIKDKPTLKPASTPDGKVVPVTLSNCVAQTSYVATVVAAAGKVASVASTATPVECQK